MKPNAEKNDLIYMYKEKHLQYTIYIYSVCKVLIDLCRYAVHFCDG